MTRAGFLDGLVREFPPRRIFLFALASALFQILFFPSGFGFGAGWETVSIARELVRTGTYGNPFEAGHSGPTAVIPPAFPMFLAALLKLLGDTAAFAKVASILGMLAQAFAAALLPRVSGVLFEDERPGVIAGLFAAFAYRLVPQWDAPYTACALALFFIFSGVSTARRALFSGAAAGLLLLMNPASLVVTVPWILFLCVCRKAALRRFAAFAAGTAIVALPWILRNERVLGTLSIKDNVGIVLFTSNNDCASASLQSSMETGCHSVHNPNKSAAELQLLNRMGEAAYDKLRTRDAMLWARTHPLHFAQLTLERVAEFWFPPVFQAPWCSMAVWLATALSFPGLLLLFRRDRPLGWYMIAVMALYPLPYYVVVSEARYRYPLLWASLLCAGYLLAFTPNLITALSPVGAPPFHKTPAAGAD